MRVEDLERELRAQRPHVDGEFARRLDEWAEAGFPRDRGLGPAVAGRPNALRRFWDRVAATPPRRIALPVGALATVAVIAGVVITNGNDLNGAGSNSSAPLSTASPAEQATSGGAGSAAGAAPDSSAGEDSIAPSAAAPSAESSQAQSDSTFAAPATPARGGGAERIVDATARLTLGADTDQVQDVANGVVDVTDRYGGVVADSQVSSDQSGARASFSLEIPYRNLDAALADLSDLADVISRTEGTEDITANAVRARKQLAATLDQIRAARVDLIKADTREQRLVLKSQIQSLEATADAQRNALSGVKRQGRFATVNVDVTSGASGADDDGGWSLGDALDDAGSVLEVIGGVLLVSLAVLIPLGLIAGLIAFALSRARRRSRERALDS